MTELILYWLGLNALLVLGLAIAYKLKGGCDE